MKSSKRPSTSKTILEVNGCTDQFVLIHVDQNIKEAGLQRVLYTVEWLIGLNNNTGHTVVKKGHITLASIDIYVRC